MPANRIRALDPSVSGAPIPSTSPGWKMSAKTLASAVEMASTTSAGCRRAISTPVTTGTSSSHGVRWKVRDVEYSSICAAGTPSCESPSTVKITSAITMDGTVVTIR